jgi:flavin reductase (DIM6/NTAB) family NADH-FMN oxidoreductase RutF
MVGRVLQRTRLGDHFGFLLEPVAVHHGRSSEPLRFHAAKGIDPGHEA